ncbi:uncharacterized protein LTR77_006788 [Saxophila tyrrhenica]|uniref:Amidase domain-containing protein n=1 Tax=Saxophila tyrrhenica TaxID=1690608 RepID=A0AAV9P6J2_9PEZI|nr:hypothetical protein LTR77_006788 [Saxophila tyrrhenica]
MSAVSDHEEPWKLTAAEVLPLLRSGELKVLDLAKSLLTRIHQRDESVKAWVWLSPSQILQQAQVLDDIPSAQRGPLHGLPVGVKDIILTKDMPTQYNSKLYQSETPINADANCIITLRQAGALIFGKTTTTEFASSKQGNWHQNHTANPHDLERTPGGSSSGSGAAVGDFQIPVALGTQTGGSIIRPASFNGCYGFKPTWGSISREGIAQWSWTLDTCGFLCRSVEDVERILDVFQVMDDEPIPKEPFSLKGAVIGFAKTHNWPAAGPGTEKAMEKAVELLKKQGARAEAVDLPEDMGFDNALKWHNTVLNAEGKTSFLGQYRTDTKLLHDDIVGYVENRKNVSRKDQLEAYDSCARLRVTWDEIASKCDLVITPSIPDEAPKGLENTGNMTFCSMWTMLHAPALNIPGFAGENGLPIGLTAVAPRFRDRHLLHVARTIGPLFEKEGGWQRKNVESIPIRQPVRRSSTGLRST